MSVLTVTKAIVFVNPPKLLRLRIAKLGRDLGSIDLLY